MNTYAMNLVKKWNQLSVKHSNFASYLSDIKDNLISLHSDKNKLKNYFSPFNIFCQMFLTLLWGCLAAIGAIFAYSQISNEIPTSSQLLAFFLGFTISKFAFSFLFNDIRNLKKNIAQKETFVAPFLKEISAPLGDPEQLKNILPILEDKIQPKSFKQILLNASKGSLGFPDAHQIYLALNEYFEENINSQNFTTIHTLLDKEEEKFLKDKPNNNSIDENIRFFTK